MDFHSRHTPPLTIRPATHADADRLKRLAQLDEGEVPASPVLLGFVGEELWAALSLETGAAIADPFRPSADVVTLLVRRGRQLTGSAGRGRRIWFRKARPAEARPVGFELKAT